MSDNICEDLVVEVFTRLPPKSLIRFRSASKSLCARIATQDFIRLHTIRSNRIPEKVLLRHEIPHRVGDANLNEIFYTLHTEYQLPDHGYDGITSIKFPFPLGSRARAVGSCNGIMLLLDDRDLIFWLWNPSIRRKLKLPRYPLNKAYIFLTGFAFDRVTEDYKIVTLSDNEQNYDIPYAFVYSMKTRTWCQISNPVTPSTYETRIRDLVHLFLTSEGHLVNGVLHWVVKVTNESTRRANIHVYILTFDVSTHVFGTIELPRHKYSAKLTSIAGSLAVITYKDVTNKDHYANAQIWVRKENNTTPNWVAYLSFKVDYYASVMPLSINGYFLVKYLPNDIEVYCDRTKARSRLVEFSDFSNIQDMSWFAESLELLDTGSPYEESKAMICS